MAHYRIHFLTPEADDIARAEDLIADGDQAALLYFVNRSGAQSTELWCAGRKIARLVPDGIISLSRASG